tara:strand:+ start:92 stop:286 length:195 start_codon:yes stop_codon:yes gene_type:complete
MQIESGMTKHEIQIALQDLYTILTDLGFTDTATAINCAEDTLMDEKIDLSTRCQISEYLSLKND